MKKSYSSGDKNSYYFLSRLIKLHGIPLPQPTLWESFEKTKKTKTITKKKSSKHWKSLFKEIISTSNSSKEDIDSCFRILEIVGNPEKFIYKQKKKLICFRKEGTEFNFINKCKTLIHPFLSKLLSNIDQNFEELNENAKEDNSQSYNFHQEEMAFLENEASTKSTLNDSKFEEENSLKEIWDGGKEKKNIIITTTYNPIEKSFQDCQIEMENLRLELLQAKQMIQEKEAKIEELQARITNSCQYMDFGIYLNHQQH